MPDKWLQYAEPAKSGDKWAQYAETSDSQPAAPPAAPKEGFFGSLAHSFGLPSSIEEARRMQEQETAQRREHPVATAARALAGPAGQLAEGAYQGAKRIGGEVGEAVTAGREGNPYKAAEHASYALPFVGPGIKRGVEQLGPHEVINPAEVGTALGTAIQTAPMVADAVMKPVRGLAPRAAEGVRKGAQSLVGAGERPVKAIVAKDAIDAGKVAKKTIQANREAAAEHATTTAEVKAANAEAVKAQNKIAPTQEKLKAAGRELQAQIETARNNALKEGNSKYNTVNVALNPVEADPEFYSKSLLSAAESIKGSAPEPTFLRAIEKRIETGDPIRYEDLQADYSRLGKELSKGTLPGDVYHAYDQMHEAIGGEMQRIADAHGQGPQLTAARNYWRRMKQAFGKPYNPTDTGNTVLEKATGQGTAEEQANRVRLLGSFDKSIPQTVEHIGNLRKGLEALPDTKPLRDVVKPLPAKLEPTQIHAPEVNTRALRENLVDRWAGGESSLNKWQVRSLVSGGLGSLFGFFAGGARGAEVAGVASYVLGPAAIARLVEMPAVREWLTRPPAGELETLRKLPSADRLRITDTLSRVVKQSSAFGRPINVSPAVGALIAGGLAPRQNPTDEWAGVPHNP